MNLTEDEKSFLRALVRQKIKKHVKDQKALQVAKGDSFDPEIGVKRMRRYRAVYRKLGGDPNRMDVRS